MVFLDNCYLQLHIDVLFVVAQVTSSRIPEKVQASGRYNMFVFAAGLDAYDRHASHESILSLRSSKSFLLVADYSALGWEHFAFLSSNKVPSSVSPTHRNSIIDYSSCESSRWIVVRSSVLFSSSCSIHHCSTLTTCVPIPRRCARMKKSRTQTTHRLDRLSQVVGKVMYVSLRLQS